MLGANYQDVSDSALKFVAPRSGSRTRACVTGTAQFADQLRLARLPRDVRDRPPRPDRRAAPRPGRPGVAGPHAAAAARGEGVRRVLARARAAARVRAPARAPQASLPDIEDEVMCVECGTALNVSTSTVADQERAFIRRQIALGKDKQRGQGRARRRVRRRRAAPTRRRAASTSPPGSSRSLLALLARRRRRVAARRWRRAGRRRGRAAGEPLADEDARRLDAELAAYDRR